MEILFVSIFELFSERSRLKIHFRINANIPKCFPISKYLDISALSIEVMSTNAGVDDPTLRMFSFMRVIARRVILIDIPTPGKFSSVKNSLDHHNALPSRHFLILDNQGEQSRTQFLCNSQVPSRLSNRSQSILLQPPKIEYPEPPLQVPKHPFEMIPQKVES